MMDGKDRYYKPSKARANHSPADCLSVRAVQKKKHGINMTKSRGRRSERLVSYKLILMTLSFSLFTWKSARHAFELTSAARPSVC